MVVTDPIADMLTRIRNANIARSKQVEVPASNIKKELARLLKEEGYIQDYELIEDNKQGILRLQLKFNGKEPIITGLKRISRPGLRFYVEKDQIPKVLGGLGIAILSTSKGIMTDKVARQLGIGGEVLCFIW